MKFSRSNTRTVLAFLPPVLMALFAITISAQQKREERRGLPQQDSSIPQRPPEQLSASVLTDSGKDHLISPGDVIEIQVEDAPELSRNYQVTAAGDIEMSVLGRVTVRGKTVYELARQVAGGLREREYLKTPNVTVTVKQLRSRTFFIQGAVQKSGLYQLEGQPSLLTLIGLAGGLTDNHSSSIFILRPTKIQERASDNQNSNSQPLYPEPGPATKSSDSKTVAAADYELIKVNLTTLYKGQFDQNLKLEPGDIVNIPRADVFFVAGEVKEPGSFTLKDGTTLRQAISLAQGMTFKAKSSRGIIFREDAVTGSRKEIKVDIGAVMNGKKEDILVQANDVIIIPNSQAKSLGGTILMTFGINSVRLPLPY